MKIGMIGSLNYTNASKVKEFLVVLRDTFDSELVIVSGGSKLGVEPIVKKFALQFGINYMEFNPAFTPVNLYSAMPENYYSKPKHGSQYLHRYLLLATAVEKLIIFTNPGEDVSFYNITINKMKKRGKSFVFVN